MNSSKYEAVYEHFAETPNITTDSRRVSDGVVFVALHGEHSDGNDFALKAIENGASWAVVDRADVAAADSRCLLVDDTLAALQGLAAIHRRRLGIPILALTGSSGKTTTKELVTAVLARKFRVSATVGNLNNHIGVPLTLLSMDPSTQIGVVEMGASAQGEIAFSCSMAAPTFGLITNIGRSHLCGFGGDEGIRRGKGELYDFLAATGGTAFVRTDDPVLMLMAAERKTMRCIGYGSDAADGFSSQLVGDYNRFNIAAAVAVGRYFGIAEEEIAAAIAGYKPSNNRSQSLRTEHNLLTVDCYNANPSSMGAAVTNFTTETHPEYRRRTLILGDMLELGDWSEAEHERIVALAMASGADRMILIGSNFGATTSADQRIERYASTDEFVAALAAKPVTDSFVLVKGSHAIGLERIIPLL